MEIKKIVYKKGRYSLYFSPEERPPLSLKEDVFVRHNLYKGKEISLEDLEKIQDQSQVQEAIDFVLPKLRAKKTVFQVQDLLSREGFSDSAIARALAYLKTYQFLDDRDYVASFIHDKRRFNHYGKLKLFYLLRQKGVSEDLIQEGLEDITEEMEYDLALSLGKKRIHHYDLETFKGRGKFLRYLYGKGFAKDLALRVLESLNHDE
ncbi:MAG: RecX family transcriptional regulator [Tissierellia bacterium]|nr:RecX family transcriptional regulator [Tissierellia bacterium]